MLAHIGMVAVPVLACMLSLQGCSRDGDGGGGGGGGGAAGFPSTMDCGSGCTLKNDCVNDKYSINPSSGCSGYMAVPVNMNNATTCGGVDTEWNKFPEGHDCGVYGLCCLSSLGQDSQNCDKTAAPACQNGTGAWLAKAMEEQTGAKLAI